MTPIAFFQAAFTMLMDLGFSDALASRIAAGHGLLRPLARDERLFVARA